MKKILSFALLSLVSCQAAYAGDTLKKEVSTVAITACGQQPGITYLNPRTARNLNAYPVPIMCGVSIDSSENGTLEFGAVLSNTGTLNRVVSCTAEISRVSGGPAYIQRNVIVGPKENVRVRWTAGDMDWKTFIGGQAGFTCTLPQGMAIQWVYTQSRSN